jgi:hypothetical protein
MTNGSGGIVLSTGARRASDAKEQARLEMQIQAMRTTRSFEGDIEAADNVDGAAAFLGEGAAGDFRRHPAQGFATPNGSVLGSKGGGAGRDYYPTEPAAFPPGLLPGSAPSPSAGAGAIASDSHAGSRGGTPSGYRGALGAGAAAYPTASPAPYSSSPVAGRSSFTAAAGDAGAAAAAGAGMTGQGIMMTPLSTANGRIAGAAADIAAAGAGAGPAVVRHSASEHAIGIATGRSDRGSLMGAADSLVGAGGASGDGLPPGGAEGLDGGGAGAGGGRVSPGAGSHLSGGSRYGESADEGDGSYESAGGGGGASHSPLHGAGVGGEGVGGELAGPPGEKGITWADEHGYALYEVRGGEGGAERVGGGGRDLCDRLHACGRCCRLVRLRAGRFFVNFLARCGLGPGRTHCCCGARTGTAVCRRLLLPALRVSALSPLGLASPPRLSPQIYYSDKLHYSPNGAYDDAGGSGFCCCIM